MKETDSKTITAQEYGVLVKFLALKAVINSMLSECNSDIDLLERALKLYRTNTPCGSLAERSMNENISALIRYMEGSDK